MKTIRLIISPQGQTLLETKGFAGSSCREASEFLEQALGHSTHEALTSEFHQPAAQHADQYQSSAAG